ncbi:MAG: hypothetical protein ISS16_08015 [Ignavibacteria bacterium]|nr:hypothetical protein [Ignavibacteria bacterium]
MNQKWIAVLIFFFLSIKLYAQSDFSFSGYVVDLPIYQFPKESTFDSLNKIEEQFLNLTRARFRSEYKLWSDARFNLEYEIDALYYSSSDDFEFSMSGKSNRQLFNLTWIPVKEKHINITHFIDRLYFRQGFDFGNVIIGRQRISWGTGRIWNPTDLFNPINPAVFYKIEKDGADAVSFKYTFGNFTDINLVFNPQEKIKNSNYGFRFRTNIKEYDMSIMGGSFSEEVDSHDRRFVTGLDFAGNLFNAGLRGEGIISINEDDSEDKFITFILGVDNQFTSRIYALLEYHYNGEGKTDKSEYDFTRLVKGEIQNLSKNYIYAGGMYQVYPLLNLSIGNITNLNDGSGFMNFLGTYSVTEDFYVDLGAQITYGVELSEYWYYPISLYLEMEYYF